MKRVLGHAMLSIHLRRQDFPQGWCLKTNSEIDILRVQEEEHKMKEEEIQQRDATERQSKREEDQRIFRDINTLAKIQRHEEKSKEQKQKKAEQAKMKQVQLEGKLGRVKGG